MMHDETIVARKVRLELDQLIKEKLNKEKFFMQICSKPIEIEQSVYDEFASRYDKLIEFYKKSEQLFKKSFHEPKFKFVSELILGEKYDVLYDLHKFFYDNLGGYKPLFFRTDEPVPGKIVELQIPGSGAAGVGELQKIWAKHGNYESKGDWISQYIDNITECCNGEPKIFYIPIVGQPDDRELFQKLTSEQGLEYIDPLKEPLDNFNYIKTHAYLSFKFRHEFKELFILCYQNNIKMEPSPSIISESKIPLIFPFDERTREYFTDDIRNMFPYSQLISPYSKVNTNDGSLSHDQLCDLPRNKRNYFVKYAGPLGTLNYGGKGVFSLKKVDSKGARQIINRALSDYESSAYWILQEDIGKEYDVSILDDDGQVRTEKRYAKFNGFYGPKGLINRRVLFSKLYKVNGSPSTAVGVLKPVDENSRVRLRFI